MLERRPRGRPRAFHYETALEVAMRLFWSRGYQGTGIADLTQAMSLAAPSLYAAFGNKQGLFRAAVDHYQSSFGGYVADALSRPRAREAAAAIVEGAIDQFTRKDWPTGCLVVLNSFQSLAGEDDGEVAAYLRQQREDLHAAIAERLRRAQADGDLPDASDAGILAWWLVQIVEGLAVAARSGLGRPELDRLAETALSGWPA